MVVVSKRLIVFDMAIESKVRKLLKNALKEHSHRSWLIEAVFWDDSDYEIKLISSWGELQDVYRFRKSDGFATYQKRKICGAGYQTLEERKLF